MNLLIYRKLLPKSRRKIANQQFSLVGRPGVTCCVSGILPSRPKAGLGSRSHKAIFPKLVPGFLSRKTRRYGHPSTAHLAFRHSGKVLAGIQKCAGVDSG
jgi:hypothetical protein